ncbi:MAG TPA: TatD family hydrolase, partial [Firmicutes bacterium]|nr:TatD family hydrolase [Bacillota bacterium]
LCPAVVQKEALRGHIRLARELGLPLILHCRDAHQDLFPLLREEKANEVGGVLHCFSGGEEEAARALDLGLYLGFTGTVTFPNAAPLRAVAAGIPLERLLVETDCPYLAPHPWRGKRNEPAYVVRVVETVAEVRGLTPAEVAGAAAANACRLFRHA